MKLASKIYGHYDELEVVEYQANKEYAVILVDQDGDSEPISVNLPDAKHFGEGALFWADVSNCSEAITELEKMGAIQRGVAEYKSGFVSYPEYKVVDYDLQTFREQMVQMQRKNYEAFVIALASLEDVNMTPEEYDHWLHTEWGLLSDGIVNDEYRMDVSDLD